MTAVIMTAVYNDCCL